MSCTTVTTAADAGDQSFVAKYEGGERRLDIIEFITVARAIGIKNRNPRRIGAAKCCVE